MHVLEARDHEHMVYAVVSNLRLRSVVEVTATRSEDTENHRLIGFVRSLDSMRGMAMLRYVLCNDSMEPVACFNVYRTGICEVTFQVFATPAWPSIAGSMLGWCRRAVVQELLAEGIRVGDILALVIDGAGVEDTLDRWFALMGALPSGPPQPRGRNGELYQHYVWTAPREAEHVQKPIRPTGNGWSGSRSDPGEGRRSDIAGETGRSAAEAERNPASASRDGGEGA